MNKKIKKNTLLILSLLLIVHVLGLIYQIVAKLPTLSILLKELFVLITLVQIVLIKLEVRKFKIICSILNIVIIIISAIYMDFLSVIISVLLILYILNSNSTEKDIINKEIKQKKSPNNNRRVKNAK